MNFFIDIIIRAKVEIKRKKIYFGLQPAEKYLQNYYKKIKLICVSKISTKVKLEI